MTAENTRAAAPGDLVARLRDAAAEPPGGTRGLMDCTIAAWAADVLAAQDAEIARLRAALARIVALGDRVDMSGQCAIAVAIIAARAALSPPPASDGLCCQRTRLRGAPCPAGRVCPHDGGEP